MAKYVISICEDFDESTFEPAYETNDWEEWYKIHRGEYTGFRVYEGKKLIFDSFVDVIDCGMALYYWKDDEDEETTLPHIIYDYPDRTRNDSIPDEVLQYFKEFVEEEEYDDIEQMIYRGGSFGALMESDDVYVVYGDYENGIYAIGY